MELARSVGPPTTSAGSPSSALRARFSRLAVLAELHGPLGHVRAWAFWEGTLPEVALTRNYMEKKTPMLGGRHFDGFQLECSLQGNEAKPGTVLVVIMWFLLALMGTEQPSDRLNFEIAGYIVLISATPSSRLAATG